MLEQSHQSLRQVDPDFNDRLALRAFFRSGFYGGVVGGRAALGRLGRRRLDGFCFFAFCLRFRGRLGRGASRQFFGLALDDKESADRGNEFVAASRGGIGNLLPLVVGILDPDFNLRPGALRHLVQDRAGFIGQSLQGSAVKVQPIGKIGYGVTQAVKKQHADAKGCCFRKIECLADF